MSVIKFVLPMKFGSISQGIRPIVITAVVFGKPTCVSQAATAFFENCGMVWQMLSENFWSNFLQRQSQVTAKEEIITQFIALLEADECDCWLQQMDTHTQ